MDLQPSQIVPKYPQLTRIVQSHSRANDHPICWRGKVVFLLRKKEKNTLTLTSGGFFTHALLVLFFNSPSQGTRERSHAHTHLHYANFVEAKIYAHFGSRASERSRESCGFKIDYSNILPYNTPLGPRSPQQMLQIYSANLVL